jgi:hypothetical protein
VLVDVPPEHVVAVEPADLAAELLAQGPDDKLIQLPNGKSVEVLSERRMLAGSNDGAISWNGPEPVYGAIPPSGHMSAPGPEDD